MLSDLRYAFRQLVKSPGFTVIAVLTLALGIGANTAIFSVINSALLQPLHYEEPGQLVELWTKLNDGGHLRAITGPQFKQLRDHAASFSSISIAHPVARNLIDQGKAERISGLQVSSNFLQTLRLTPLHGADFDRHADEVGGNSHVVMLAYDWWQSRFGGDPTVVGRTLILNQVAHTVAGVLPADALVHKDAQFLIPVVIDAEPWRLAPDNPWAPTITRLKAGVTLTQAAGETTTIANELAARSMPDRPNIRPLELRPLQDVLVSDSRPTLLILLGAVALVLLIACANVANLLLVRATSRQREVAVRSAMGATSGRIVRQMLTESLVLALLGGFVGVLFALFGVELFARTVLVQLPHMLQPTVSLPVLGYSLALSLGTGILFGLLPALRARQIDLTQDLKDSGRGATSGSRTRTQSFLIIAEVALTSALLIGAGLLLRSFQHLMQTDLGFNPRQAIVCDMALTDSKYPTPDTMVQYYRELVRKLEELPGVVSVGTTTTLPLSNEGWGGRIGLSEVPVGEHNLGSGSDHVSGHYFEAMGITLLKGRVITDADNVSSAPRVAVINEVLANTLMPGTDPIGRHVRFRDVDYEVVGLVRSIRQGQISQPPGRRIYVPHVTDPYTARLVIRTAVAPASLIEAVKRTVAAVDPEQSVSNIRTLEQTVERSLRENRVALVLIGIFAALALGLACLGIYGVMAYTIGQRERELSIRMALGADLKNIVTLVLRDGLKLGLIGIATGLFCGYGGARLIASKLYEVGTLDPVVFLSVTVAVALVAFVAIYFPALRAARADARAALRGE